MLMNSVFQHYKDYRNVGRKILPWMVSEAVIKDFPSSNPTRGMNQEPDFFIRKAHFRLSFISLIIQE